MRIGSIGVFTVVVLALVTSAVIWKAEVDDEEPAGNTQSLGTGDPEPFAAAAVRMSGRPCGRVRSARREQDGIIAYCSDGQIYWIYESPDGQVTVVRGD